MQRRKGPRQGEKNRGLDSLTARVKASGGRNLCVFAPLRLCVEPCSFFSLIPRKTAKRQTLTFQTYFGDIVPNSLWKFSSTVRARVSSGSLRSSEAKRYTATRFAG